MRPSGKVRAAWAALLTSVMLLGCDRGSDEAWQPPHEARDWSLLVVLLDALPAHALGCYGAERDVSPNIDALATDALLFEQAYSSASYTLTSVASLFTGLGPVGHGVLGLNTNVLPDGALTFAEALSEAGFATAAFSCNPHITPSGGFDQGFGHFRHYFRDRYDAHTVPEELPGEVTTWWREHADQRRFAYVHLLPPHQPYDPPEPHASLFGVENVPREEGLTDFLVELGKTGEVVEASPLMQRVRARYDAGLHYVDAIVGELLAELDQDQGLADTVVVLLSDHGEAFGEHGTILHGGSSFTELVRVPLLIRWPGLRPRTHPSVVRTRDLAASLCELLSVPWPDDHGSPFLARALDSLGGRGSDAPPALSRSHGNRPMWSLRTPEWTYVRHAASGTSMLFDRRTDPQERVDLAASRTDAVTALDALLDRILDEDRRAGTELQGKGRRSTRHLEELRALGYTDEGE